MVQLTNGSAPVVHGSDVAGLFGGFPVHPSGVAVTVRDLVPLEHGPQGPTSHPVHVGGTTVQGRVSTWSGGFGVLGAHPAGLATYGVAIVCTPSRQGPTTLWPGTQVQGAGGVPGAGGMVVASSR